MPHQFPGDEKETNKAECIVDPVENCRSTAMRGKDKRKRNDDLRNTRTKTMTIACTYIKMHRSTDRVKSSSCPRTRSSRTVFPGEKKKKKKK
jgi:hypothetical protein